MENKELSGQFFLSNLSHEIRTPLNGIVGYNQLLLQTKLDNTQQMYVNSMNQCCIQLVELVNDILDFSKLATGKGHINNECFCLKEIIEEVTSANNYKIKEKKQKITYIIDDKLPEYLISDKNKIIQIIINLVSNANKFTPIEGKIEVSFSCSSIPDENILVCYVKDNGMGISLENQKKIFEPFVQINESLTKNGSGLGLAICKKLIELLGGNISVESDLSGSIFKFSIKYEPHERFQKYIEKNSDILKGKYILVVDDNVDNRLLLSEILFEYRMIPVICSSGKEALHMIAGKRYPFALAILDICMPVMTGTELATQIKEINNQIPLIALSSLDGPFDKYNFEYVLNKPINKVKLIDSIVRTITKNDVNQYKLNPEDDKILTFKRDVRLLITEDIQINSDMLSKMLNNMGYTNIDIAPDGQVAIEKIQQKYNQGYPYDILLLDLKMPKIDGFQVADFVKKSNYLLPKIAVLTASVLENDKERCKDLGIKYFLLKPFNMTHLSSVINNMLNGCGKAII